MDQAYDQQIQSVTKHWIAEICLKLNYRMLILHTYIQAFTINFLRQLEIISTIPISFLNPYCFLMKIHAYIQAFFIIVFFKMLEGFLKKTKPYRNTLANVQKEIE